jgi:peptidoglycan/xylan/chitin deacetylase (PgdA/CDA1 family)
MTLLHTHRFSSWVRGHLVCRVDDVSDQVALTFDDGPSGADTPRVLDLLARHGARATFFTLAQNVRRHPDLVRRMVAEGHEVAIHGELHLPLLMLPPGLIRREIRRSADAVLEAANVTARHYRPPFGLMVPSQARFVQKIGYTSVLGDVYPEDAYQPPVATIVARVLRRITAGSILILHDGSPIGEPSRARTVEALDIILRHLATHALKGVSVERLLAASKEGARRTGAIRVGGA